MNLKRQHKQQRGLREHSVRGKISVCPRARNCQLALGTEAEKCYCCRGEGKRRLVPRLCRMGQNGTAQPYPDGQKWWQGSSPEALSLQTPRGEGESLRGASSDVCIWRSMVFHLIHFRGRCPFPARKCPQPSAPIKAEGNESSLHTDPTLRVFPHSLLVLWLRERSPPVPQRDALGLREQCCDVPISAGKPFAGNLTSRGQRRRYGTTSRGRERDAQINK